MVRSSYEHDENDTVIQYIQSSFNNTKDMIKLYEYVEDNIYEHGNKTNGYISTSMLPFPMDIIDIQKWNKLYSYCDIDYVALVKFCMDKGHIPYLFGSDSSTYYPRTILRQPKINNGLVDFGRDEKHEKMCNDYMIFEHQRKPELESCDSRQYFDRLPTWGKIAISKPYNEQEYIDYFVSNDFPLNRLRNTLKLLVKNSLELHRRQIDEKENTERLLKYNHLLQKYCSILIQRCEQYLEKQAKSQKVPISL
ncbi:hypothetical protein TVAG_374750 [Trichomonas vaginalis G3]|uniref:Uncharacterized protein n=1 Tax=Trichomonas vaginalis (strain ATCC PRA-98 / G3) TaxID=412133 RepID=A2FCI8_TRIV3|nr:hypothetical protein TVAGG3_0151410 [Trichomonas vaginalis G3]EAX97394.1 hypothetical protein TVAG_374750 [Trichomonas vaginalis G3]KAI5547292.1 hypothetical protein TVAGG3_0151410 [Trichomonas vaginalis G3]|eukprot:XP_001310324.1 hypothetical protein [Trichomonas vaginalis G3]